MIVETSKGKLPVRYSWNALAKFGDMAGKSMEEIFHMDLKTLKISDALMFLYVGFVEGARKAEQECAVKSTEDVGDLIDENPNIINEVMKAFAEMAGAGEKGESKKK